MDDDSIAEKLKRMLAAGMPRSDGVSMQTKRALMEHGVLMPEQPAEPAQPAAVGGPSPSAELQERVRLQNEARAAESLRRVMEKRRGGMH